MRSVIQKLWGESRLLIEGRALAALRLTGLYCLNRETTATYLSGLGYSFEPGVSTVLRINDRTKRLEILRTGLIRVNHSHVLSPNYSSRAALFSLLPGRSRPEPKVAALWSHYWMGYYHWIIDVLPKLCALREEFGADLGGFRPAYPFAQAAFEIETLALLGFDTSRFIDTYKVGTLEAKEIWFMPISGWEKISPGVERLRDLLVPHGIGTAGDRIYVSRAGRRRCANEGEVFALLEPLGFTFVEDRPRSVAEQIGIFRNARVIIGPHGAAFTNLLWCAPGTRVLELMAPEYMPDFYRNLAARCGLEYRVLVSPGTTVPHWTGVAHPVRVDIGALRKMVTDFCRVDSQPFAISTSSAALRIAKTLIHKSALPVALESVRTFAAASGGKYSLELHSDGSLSPEDFRRLREVASGVETSIIEPPERAAAIAPALQGRPGCASLLQRGGYMAKLTVLASASEPFFYFDSDIIWLKPFHPIAPPGGCVAFSTETWSWYHGMRKYGKWIGAKIPRRVNSGFAFLSPPFPFDRLETMISENLYDPDDEYATDQEILAYLYPAATAFLLQDFSRSRVGLDYRLDTLSAVALHFPGRMWERHLDQIQKYDVDTAAEARTVGFQVPERLEAIEVARMQLLLKCERTPALQKLANIFRRARNWLR